MPNLIFQENTDQLHSQKFYNKTLVFMLKRVVIVFVLDPPFMFEGALDSKGLIYIRKIETKKGGVK